MYKETDTEKDTIKSKTKRRIGFGIWTIWYRKSTWW
jgi:hypothetical protein